MRARLHIALTLLACSACALGAPVGAFAAEAPSDDLAAMAQSLLAGSEGGEVDLGALDGLGSSEGGDPMAEINAMLDSPEIAKLLTPEQLAELKRAVAAGDLRALSAFLTSPDTQELKGLLESGELEAAVASGDLSQLTDLAGVDASELSDVTEPADAAAATSAVDDSSAGASAAGATSAAVVPDVTSSVQLSSVQIEAASVAGLNLIAQTVGATF